MWWFSSVSEVWDDLIKLNFSDWGNKLGLVML